MSSDKLLNTPFLCSWYLGVINEEVREFSTDTTLNLKMYNNEIIICISEQQLNQKKDDHKDKQSCNRISKD
jgi:hypothetical protein